MKFINKQRRQEIFFYQKPFKFLNSKDFIFYEYICKMYILADITRLYVKDFMLYKPICKMYMYVVEYMVFKKVCLSYLLSYLQTKRFIEELRF